MMNFYEGLIMLSLLIGILAIHPGVQVETKPQSLVAAVGDLNPPTLPSELAFDAYFKSREGIAFEEDKAIASLMDDLLFADRKTKKTSGEDFNFKDSDTEDNDNDSHLLLTYEYKCNGSACENIALQAVLPQTFEYRLKDEKNAGKSILWSTDRYHSFRVLKVPFAVVPAKDDIKLVTKE